MLFSIRATQQCIDHHAVERQHAGDPGATPGELLRDEAYIETSQARATEIRWHGQVQQADFQRFSLNFDRIANLAITFNGARQDFFFGELARQILDQLLVWREGEIHYDASFPVRWRIMA